MNCVKEYEKMVNNIKDRVEIELEKVDLSDLEFDLIDDCYSKEALAFYNWDNSRRIKTNLKYFYEYLNGDIRQTEDYNLVIAHEIGHYIHEKYFGFNFFPQLQTLVFYFGDIGNIELFAEAFSVWVTDEDRENEIVIIMEEILSKLK